MKPRFVAFLAFVCLMVGLLAAQSNQVMDSLLAEKEANFGDTAYLALVGGAWIADSAAPSEAFALAQSKGWIPKTVTADTSIDLESFCLLAMKALKVKGGLGWTLFGSKRYAYRELVAQGIANASGGPKRLLPGDEVVRMLGRISTLGGASK